MNEPTAPGGRGRRAWQTLFLALLGCGLLVLAYHLRAIFTPLLVALALAYMFNPVVTALEKRGVKRVWTIAGIYVVFFGGVALAAIFGLPALVRQGADFFNEVLIGEPLTDDRNGDGEYDPGDGFEDINGNGAYDGPKIARVLAWSQKRLKELTGTEDILENLKKLRERAKGHEGEIAKAAGEVAMTVLSGVARAVGGALAAVSFVVLVPVYLFFMLKGMNELWARAQQAIPSAYRDRVLATLARIHGANAAFFRGQVTIALIEGTVVFVVLTALGVRFSLLFAAMYAVLALVPFVGVALTFAATALFVFVDTGGFSKTFFAVAGLFVFVQVLEGFVLQPFILGKNVGLHPVAIILSIFIFGGLFGFFGVLLAIPLASATIIVAEDYLLPIVREVTEKPG